MGLSSITNRVAYVGDGSSTVFSFPYYFFNPQDLNVYLFDTGSSIATAQILNTNYTVSGQTDALGVYPAGGSIIMTSSIPSTLEVVITRSPSAIQNFVLGQNQPVPSAPLVKQLDYMTALIQRLKEQFQRSVRLPDGVGPANGSSFDTVLPQYLNLTAYAGAPLVLNSGATGFTFGLIANGSASSVSYAGILPVQFGGTGQGLPLNPFGILFASNSSAMSTIAPVAIGSVLQSQGSSAPTWLAFSATGGTSNIVSRDANGNSASNSFQNKATAVTTAGSSTILSASSSYFQVAQGTQTQQFNLPDATTLQIGWSFDFNNNSTQSITVKDFTGATTIATVLPGAAAKVYAIAVSTQAGAWDVHFLLPSNAVHGNTGLNLSVGSSVTGVLPIVNGGTAGSSALQAYMNLSPATLRGQIVVVGSGGVSVAVNGGNDGNVLTYNSGAATPISWSSPSGTVSVVSRTSNYQMSSSDDVVLVSSSGFTVTLPDATISQNRKRFHISKTDSPFAIVNLVGSGSQTIGGFSGRTLATQNEAWTLVPDGANWQILDHQIDETFQTLSTGITPIAFGALTSTNAAIARRGQHAKIVGRFTTVAVSASTASLQLSAGLSLDVGTIIASTRTFVGSFYIQQVGTYGANSLLGAMSVENAAADTIYFSAAGSSTSFNKAASNQVANAANRDINYEIEIPIANWCG